MLELVAAGRGRSGAKAGSRCALRAVLEEMMKPMTEENRAWLHGRREYAAAECTFGFPETLSLFHALAGLCAGWMWGALHGLIAGVSASMGGWILGFIVGFVITRLPREVNVAAARIGRQHRRLALALFVMSGHLIWFGLGVAFWRFWVRSLRP